MPKLFDLEVSDEVWAANQHLAKPAKLPKTDVERMIQAEQRQVLERRFDGLWLRCGGIPDFWQPGYLFDADRGWHIDRYNAEHRIGVELHGGQFMRKSGHSNTQGQQRDWEKLLRCHELDILLIALTTAMVSPPFIDRVVAIVNHLPALPCRPPALPAGRQCGRAGQAGGRAGQAVRQAGRTN